MTLTINVINNREFSIWCLEWGYKGLVPAAVTVASDHKVVLSGCVRITNSPRRKVGLLSLYNSAERS